MLQFVRKQACDERLGRRIGGLEYDETVPPEQIVEEAGECRVTTAP